MLMVPIYMPQDLAHAENTDFQPEVFQINIYHDDWCDLITRQGTCNCNPEVGEEA